MRAMGRGREGSGSLVVGHVNVRSGARARGKSVVVERVEAVVGGGRGGWMLMEEVGARIVVLSTGSLGVVGR